MYSQTTLYKKLGNGKCQYSQGFSPWLVAEIRMSSKTEVLKTILSAWKKQIDLKECTEPELRSLVDTYLLDVDTLETGSGVDLKNE